tara:strand:- start:1064 stop:1843 length:780 start_codon:yes stop_codon:yes gene_type:complete
MPRPPRSPIKAERREILHQCIKDDAFWDQLFDNLGQGASLSELCKDLKWYGKSGKSVPYTSVWVAIDVRTDLSDRYARAKSARVDGLSQEVIKIADDVKNGVLDPQAGRVAADQYKWAASKFYPKMYGEKVQADVHITDITQLHLNEVRDYAKGRVKVLNPEGDKLIEEPRAERKRGDTVAEHGTSSRYISEASPGGVANTTDVTEPRSDTPGVRAKEGHLDAEILEAANLGTGNPPKPGEGGGTGLTPHPSPKNSKKK